MIEISGVKFFEDFLIEFFEGILLGVIFIDELVLVLFVYYFVVGCFDDKKVYVVVFGRLVFLKIFLLFGVDLLKFFIGSVYFFDEFILVLEFVEEGFFFIIGNFFVLNLFFEIVFGIRKVVDDKGLIVVFYYFFVVFNEFDYFGEFMCLFKFFEVFDVFLILRMNLYCGYYWFNMIFLKVFFEWVGFFGDYFILIDGFVRFFFGKG